jgi:hypothetical protein
MPPTRTILKQFAWLIAYMALLPLSCPAFSQTGFPHSSGTTVQSADKNLDASINSPSNPNTASGKEIKPGKPKIGGRSIKPGAGNRTVSKTSIARRKMMSVNATKPKKAAKSVLLLSPDIKNSYSGLAVKGLGARDQTDSRAKTSALPLTPEFRPAVDALTPNISVDREPKTVERTAPGLSATLRAGSDTEIIGVFNLPSNASSVRPYGQPESGPKAAPSGGVMLKHSF